MLTEQEKIEADVALKIAQILVLTEEIKDLMARLNKTHTGGKAVDHADPYRYY